jgi:hypothetical protein
MKCHDEEMIDITEKFDSIESHLMGPGWSHFTCEKCGDGRHIKMEQALIHISPGKLLPAELEAKLTELKDQKDNIETLEEYIHEQGNDTKLAKMQTDLIKLQEKINKRQTELKIPDNEEMLQEMYTAMDKMLIDFGASVDASMWGPDAFSKGKKEAVSDKSGQIVVMRTTRRDRTIIPAKFVELYPVVTNELVEEGKIKIPIKYAEEKLGTEQINEISEVKVSHKYELVVKDGRALLPG